MTRRLTSTWVILLLSLWLIDRPASAAFLFATVERNGVEISDEDGFAEIPLTGTATIRVFLSLEAEEEASTFDAGFALVPRDSVDVFVDLGRVGPSLVPLGVGTWEDAAASINDDEIRVALTRDNLGGESLVAEIVVTGVGTPELFELILADREASVDRPAPLFFEVVPISTGIGSTLASISVPEPHPLLQAIASLSALAAVARATTVRTRQRASNLHRGE